MKKVLTHKYAELCSKLGDIEYKLKILSDERDLLVAQIRALNQLSDSFQEQTVPNKDPQEPKA